MFILSQKQLSELWRISYKKKQHQPKGYFRQNTARLINLNAGDLINTLNRSNGIHD